MFKRTITRCSFLKCASAAAIGCVAAGALPEGTILAQATEGSAGNRKISFRLGALDSILSGKDGLSWEQAYHRAGELGFEGMELGVGRDYGQTELWNAEGRRRLRGISEASGVLTPSICLHSFWAYSFADEEEIGRAHV